MSDLSNPMLSGSTEASPPSEGSGLEQSVVRARLRQELFGTGQPKQLGRFELMRPLGEGGMGKVYLARDPDLERDVAIKVLRRESAEQGQRRKRLVREAKSLARLHHPNVVQVFEVGVDGGQLFIVMELVQGQTLRQWLDASGASWVEVLDVMCQAGEALAAAHDQGLVHRDFKPANVMIDDDGRVRVLDFGLARDAVDDDEPRELAQTLPDGVDLTETGTVLGTPAYMAPEQHRGRSATHRSDQFSFCVTLFEGLFGAHPFEATSYPELVAKVLDGRHRKAGGNGVPSSVARAVAKGLRTDPGDRHPDMRTLLARLDIKRRARPWLLAAGALAIGAAVGGGFVWSGSGKVEVAAPVVADREAACQAQAQAHARQWAEELEPVLTRQADEQGWPSNVRERLLAFAPGWPEQLAALCSLEPGAPETAARRDCVEIGAGRHASVASYIAETPDLEPVVRELLVAMLDDPSGCEAPDTAPVRSRFPADPDEARALLASWAELHRVDRVDGESGHTRDEMATRWEDLESRVDRLSSSPAKLELLAIVFFNRLAFHMPSAQSASDYERERATWEAREEAARRSGSVAALAWLALADHALAKREGYDGEGFDGWAESRSKLREAAARTREPEVMRYAVDREFFGRETASESERAALLVEVIGYEAALELRSPLHVAAWPHSDLARIEINRDNLDAAEAHLDRARDILQEKADRGHAHGHLTPPLARAATWIDEAIGQANVEARAPGEKPLARAARANTVCDGGQFAACLSLADSIEIYDGPPPTVAELASFHFGGNDRVERSGAHFLANRARLESAVFQSRWRDVTRLEREQVRRSAELTEVLGQLPAAVSDPARAQLYTAYSLRVFGRAARGTAADAQWVIEHAEPGAKGLQNGHVAMRRLALGVAHVTRGELEAARHELRKADLLVGSPGSVYKLLEPPYMAYLWLTLGDVHLRLGEIDKARSYVRDGWALVQRFDGSDRLTRDLALRLLDELGINPESVPPAVASTPEEQRTAP